MLNYAPGRDVQCIIQASSHLLLEIRHSDKPKSD